jgi:hypothetical protein
MHATTRDLDTGSLRLDLPDVIVFGRTILELRDGIEAPCLWCADASDACCVCFRTAHAAGE